MNTLRRTLALLALAWAFAQSLPAINIEEGTYYLIHASGLHLGYDKEDGCAMLHPSTDETQTMEVAATADGYYSIRSATAGGYLSLTTKNSYSTTFTATATADRAKFSFEKAEGNMLRVRCKHNGKCLGTDDTQEGAHAYLDKSGNDTRHYWLLSPTPTAEMKLGQTYALNPEATKQEFNGWGVSLCWWANMCGKWSDEKIDEIVDWLVSPDKLNFNHFRYNIGGGDDPQNAHCTAHHMGNGKGLRAEMEGFKDSSSDAYHWERDSAQRKIMLKIKEKRPDAIFEAFSNSAPYYMTYSGCCAGNADAGKDNLKPECYEEFAHYLVDVCKHYKEAYGIEFKTLDPFNEPLTSYWGANGGQEGCHFDLSSQVAMLKVLSPILRASGLSTVISASDETSVANAVSTFKHYQEQDVLGLIGQFNTHSYTADDRSRAQLAALAGSTGMPLWMSEVGGGSGSGLAANLNLAQKVMDDIRYMQPSAWIDWQYMEEGNDTWCLIRGSFADGTYERIKAFYVREQFSQFIRKGYTILNTTSGQSLAARSADGKTYVVVALNTGSIQSTHDIDLNFFDDVKASDIKAWRTSSTEDMAETTDFSLADGHLTCRLPSQSITTLVITASPKAEASNAIEAGATYAVTARAAASCALEATALDGTDGTVSIETYEATPAQQWTLTAQDGGYRLTSGTGAILTATTGYLLQAHTDTRDGQTFTIEAVDAPYHRIMCSDGTRALDLQNESTAASTNVGLWEYGAEATAAHRQWAFVRLPAGGNASSVQSPSNHQSQGLLTVLSTSDGTLRLALRGTPDGTLTISDAAGRTLWKGLCRSQETVAFPLRQGFYVIGYQSGKAKAAKIVLMK